MLFSIQIIYCEISAVGRLPMTYLLICKLMNTLVSASSLITFKITKLLSLIWIIKTFIMWRWQVYYHLKNMQFFSSELICSCPQILIAYKFSVWLMFPLLECFHWHKRLKYLNPVVLLDLNKSITYKMFVLSVHILHLLVEFEEEEKKNIYEVHKPQVRSNTSSSLVWKLFILF